MKSSTFELGLKYELSSMKTDKGGIENSNLKKLITPGAFSSSPNYNYLVKSS